MTNFIPKYAQRLQAAFGRPKDPGAASGRLKILYDYILNNSKILLDTVWISYSNCDEQKFIEKVFFLFFVSEKCRLFIEVYLSISVAKLILISLRGEATPHREVEQKSCYNVSENST